MSYSSGGAVRNERNLQPSRVTVYTRKIVRATARAWKRPNNIKMYMVEPFFGTKKGQKRMFGASGDLRSLNVESI